MIQYSFRNIEGRSYIVLSLPDGYSNANIEFIRYDVTGMNITSQRQVSEFVAQKFTTVFFNSDPEALLPNPTVWQPMAGE